MWSIPGKPDRRDRFSPFEPVEILYEFDGPRIFTLHQSDGELALACWSDESDEILRYVAVPTTRKVVDSLRTGTLGVLDALDQPRCWLCDLSAAGEVVGCLQVDFDDIPRDALPAP